MASTLAVVNLSDPTSVTTFPFGRFERFEVGGVEIGRASYEPGWRWTEHIGPTAGTALCEVKHVGFVISGQAVVHMRDGVKLTLGPGDLFSIPAGHDSWVVGDEEYVSLHFAGAERYAS